MLQKPWFKLFVWFIATFFFFLAAGVVISILKPGPSEAEVMKFMMGMMSAMDNSMMGVIMNMEGNSLIGSVVALSSRIAVPVMVFSFVLGFAIRLMQRRDAYAKQKEN